MTHTQFSPPTQLSFDENKDSPCIRLDLYMEGLYQSAGLKPKKTIGRKLKPLTVSSGRIRVGDGASDHNSALFNGDFYGYSCQQKALETIELTLKNGQSLWIQGFHGSGKSSLLAAKSKDFSGSVIVSGAELLESFHGAEGARAFSAFVCKWGELPSALFIDDGHLVFRSKSFQYYFSFVIDRLMARNVAIVIASEQSFKPSQLDERLALRLMQMGQVTIPRPSIEDKLRFIAARSSGLKINLDLAAAQLLAQGTNNFGAIEGILKQVTQAGLDMNLLSKTQLSRVMNIDGDLQESADKNQIDDILKSVAIQYKIKVKDILGPSRERRITTARHMAMYLLHQKLQLSLERIGSIFDRDHSTVLHGIQKLAGQK